MKILIGYDGSESADAAIDGLVRAGLPAKADVLIIAVTEIWVPPPPPSALEIVEEARQAHDPAELQRVHSHASKPVHQAQELGLHAKERLVALFPDWTIKVEGDYGTPASEIVRHADEWHPDLIVVGSHGRSALGRFVLGSVSQKVVTEARQSVRVGRPQNTNAEKAPRLIIGIDGSAVSAAAVQAVCRRSWPANTEIRVVIVDEPLTPTLLGIVVPPVRRWIDEINKDEVTWSQHLGETAVGKLQQAGLIAETLVREGDPKRVLVAEAEMWGADTIFVGSTGIGSRLGRFLLGSVSSAVAARAHCSVEILRSPNEVK